VALKRAMNRTVPPKKVASKRVGIKKGASTMAVGLRVDKNRVHSVLISQWNIRALRALPRHEGPRKP
jgi:hypothetical protein